ncbi:hypothetical protein BH10ACI1_BH10ACI1_04650 [soil metagenome]
MNDWERRLYEMVLRVLAFLLANAADFASIPAVGQDLEVLQREKQTLSDLGADKASKTADAKDMTIFRGDAREALRNAMEQIASMWRPMAKNHGGATNKFHFIYGSDQLLIDDAGSFISEAEPLLEAFKLRGMSADFITDLTAKRDAFIAAIGEAESAKSNRVGTNAGFAAPLRICREAVEDIAPIVKMIYKDNPSKLAQWRTASRVEKR